MKKCRSKKGALRKPALTRNSFEDFPSRTTWSCLLLRKTKWGQISDRKFHKTFKFVKKTSAPNPVKNHGYIKCYRASCPQPIKRPRNSTRYNCQKICSRSKGPKTILEIRKKATFLYVINKPIVYNTLLNTERRLTWQ